MEKYITLTRVIDAPVDKVWSAWTTPEELKQWWGPRGVTIPTSQVDAKAGGNLYIVMLAGKELGPMAGQEWPMKGVFTEVIENQKLVFTNLALDGGGNTLLEGLTTATFEEEAGPDGQSKTKLTVHTGAKGEGPNVEQMLSGMPMGWGQQLDKLGEFLAR